MLTKKIHSPHLAATVIQKVMKHFLTWRNKMNESAFKEVFKNDPKSLEEIKR